MALMFRTYEHRTMFLHKCGQLLGFNDVYDISKKFVKSQINIFSKFTLD